MNLANVKTATLSLVNANVAIKIMTVKPHLVCEELCEDFSVSTKLIERDYLFKRIEEIKCLTTLKVAPIATYDELSPALACCLPVDSRTILLFTLLFARVNEVSTL